MELSGLFLTAGDGVRLRGTRCPNCGARAFPGRAVCGACGSRELEPAELSGRGRVHGWTSVATPPAGFDAPYLAAVVDLDEGPRVFGILTAAPGPGGRVRAVPAPVRDGRPGFAFAPDPATPAGQPAPGDPAAAPVAPPTAPRETPS